MCNISINLVRTLALLASQLIPYCVPAVLSSFTCFHTDYIRPQSESVLIQKIFTHFRKAPANYKLGVLYVVDSVTRKWLEQAKQQGQPVSNAAPDGTPAAGVNRVTELMPILMDDIIASAPQDQKVRFAFSFQAFTRSLHTTLYIASSPGCSEPTQQLVVEEQSVPPAMQFPFPQGRNNLADKNSPECCA